ncbi:putative deacetylase LmbE-like domain-containing protein [Lipomyces japonicus]|uniref:putative deacetylase LmbE-like domain-containing protein n=1 Tax=Lipomyces japonicus TaxID=56871 RepID=UPI0034CED9A8
MRLRKAFAVIFISIIFWILSRFIIRPIFLSPHERTLQAHFADKRIALLIAHPDDEAMFFGPTLNSLRQLSLHTSTHGSRGHDENHANLKILCLSTGNADNLGQTRVSELQKSAGMFGIPASNVIIFDDVQVQDRFGATWPADAIAELVNPYLDEVDVIVTFDGNGVSGHGNHVSLWQFVKRMSEFRNDAGKEVWLLRSTSVIRKYLSFVDIPITYAYNWFIKVVTENEHDLASSLVVTSSARQYALTRDAMTKAHVSQMVWFRWGWISLSRYMVVNDLQRL